jgi:hypothetical protein
LAPPCACAALSRPLLRPPSTARCSLDAHALPWCVGAATHGSGRGRPPQTLPPVDKVRPRSSLPDPNRRQVITPPTRAAPVANPSDRLGCRRCSHDYSPSISPYGAYIAPVDALSFNLEAQLDPAASDQRWCDDGTVVWWCWCLLGCPCMAYGTGGRLSWPRLGQVVHCLYLLYPVHCNVSDTGHMCIFRCL